MAGTILVREALRRASFLLSDLTPAQFQRWGQRECVDFLNDAALAIVKFLPTAGSRLDAVKLKPGTRQSIETIAAADCKPGDGLAPAGPILGLNFLHATRNMGADGQTPGRAVRIVDRKMLDAQDPDWHLASRAKTVVSSIAYDPLLPRYFSVTPPVHATTPVWLEFAYNAQPIKVPNAGGEDYTATGTGGPVIPLADEHIDDLVNYLVARSNMNDSEWADANKATFFANLFLTSLNGKVAAVTGTNPNIKRLPFAPQSIGGAT